MLENKLYETRTGTQVIGMGKRVFRVLIASRSQEALETLSAIVPDNANVAVSTRLICNGHSDPLYGLDVLPDLLIFRLGPAWQAELDAVGERPQKGRVPMLVVSSEQDTGVMRRAMHAGARDFFLEPVIRDDLMAAVERLFQEAREQQRGGVATLTVVMNAKGGSGASLISSNLAQLLVAGSERRVALVDMDLQFGSLAHYLDLNPRRGIKDALDNVEELDKVALDGYLVTHKSGLRVMGAEPERLLLTDDVSHDRLVSLMDLLAETHEHLVIDLPRQVDLTTTTILERADHIVLVLQQGITHIRDAARLIEVLRQELEIDDSKITVVLNRYQKNAPITIKEVAKALKHEPVITVPNDFKHVTECLNNGTTLASVAKRAPITRSLVALAGRLEHEKKSQAQGVFSRMVSLLRRV